MIVIRTMVRCTRHPRRIDGSIAIDGKCLQVSVEVLEFPPLPPSPVEEADEESSDVGQQSAAITTKPKAHNTNRTMEYRPRVPPHRGPANLSTDSKDHQTSLNTRSMDAGFSRGRRSTPATSNSRREVGFTSIFSFHRSFIRAYQRIFHFCASCTVIHAHDQRP